jgi:hypothetical protein
LIESYNQYINKKRFLIEGVFSDFIKKKSLDTSLKKLKKVCKENNKYLPLAEYTFNTDEYRDSRKSFSSLPKNKISNFLNRKKLLYFPEFDSFYVLEDYKKELKDENLKFLSRRNVEKNSLTLQEIIERFFP